MVVVWVVVSVFALILAGLVLLFWFYEKYVSSPFILVMLFNKKRSGFKIVKLNNTRTNPHISLYLIVKHSLRTFVPKY